MSEQELNAIIAENITRLLNEQGKTQTDLAEYVGVAQATVSYWCTGQKAPRMTKIDKICQFFNVNRSELLTSPDGYYTVDGVAEIAQQILDNPNMRALFDAARDCTPEDMQLAVEMLERFRRTNPDG